MSTFYSTVQDWLALVFQPLYFSTIVYNSHTYSRVMIVIQTKPVASPAAKALIQGTHLFRGNKLIVRTVDNLNSGKLLGGFYSHHIVYHC